MRLRCTLATNSYTDAESIPTTQLDVPKNRFGWCVEHVAYHQYSVPAFIGAAEELCAVHQSALPPVNEAGYSHVERKNLRRQREALLETMRCLHREVLTEDRVRFEPVSRALLEQRHLEHQLTRLADHGLTVDSLAEFMSCYRKRGYPFKAQARQMAELLNTMESQDSSSSHLEVYLCVHCSGWHVGHTPTSASVSPKERIKNRLRMFKAKPEVAADFLREKSRMNAAILTQPQL